MCGHELLVGSLNAVYIRRPLTPRCNTGLHGRIPLFRQLSDSRPRRIPSLSRGIQNIFGSIQRRNSAAKMCNRVSQFLSSCDFLYPHVCISSKRSVPRCRRCVTLGCYLLDSDNQLLRALVLFTKLFPYAQPSTTRCDEKVDIIAKLWQVFDLAVSYQAVTPTLYQVLSDLSASTLTSLH